MPVLFAPALDLTALCAILCALALVVLAHYLAQSVASVLNFSILGIRPLANVSRALENSVVAWLGSAVNSLENVARDLWHGLTWMWGEFLDGINAMTSHTEDALKLLWESSIPAYVKTALRSVVNAVDAVDKAVSGLERLVGKEVSRLDAKIESTAKATAGTLERDITQAIKREVSGIEGDIKGIRSSVDQAIDHALGLARTESQAALGELRRAEDAALGALGAAESATADELHNLIRDLNPAQAASIIASVPLLAALVQAIAVESGLDNAACRGKVKNICGTDPSDWGWLLAGAGALGFGFSLREIIDAGNDIVSYVAAGAEDLAELG